MAEKRGRKPLGTEAMTDAERAARYRQQQRVYIEIGKQIFDRVIVPGVQDEQELAAILAEIRRATYTAQ